MKIAVEGCAHGELERIYECLENYEKQQNLKIDLLICCGDFQSVRNHDDLKYMAVPLKYQKMCSFYKYYSGEKKANILTIFIGGNHEASNYLQELPYGGWVAPNIYYLGYAGVVNVGNLRIGGLSGIYNKNDYYKGHFEIPPYSEKTKRSVYHVRNLEVFRLSQISTPIDIFITHDWPQEIYKYGNVDDLLQRKPFFKDDIDKNCLGSEPAKELLFTLKPNYWFSAHLHCKFSALVPHEDIQKGVKITKFLALDKCLPKRKFLQILDIPEKDAGEFRYDLEWLTILHYTNHLLSLKSHINFMPTATDTLRSDFKPSEEEKEFILMKFSNNLKIAENFEPTSPAHCNTNQAPDTSLDEAVIINPQTSLFCKLLGVTDPFSELIGNTNFLKDLSSSTYSEENDSTLTDLSLNISTYSCDSSSTPIKQRESISLPSPKFIEYNSDQIPDKQCISEFNKSLIEDISSSSDISEINKLFTISTEPEGAESNSMEQSLSSPKKMFKRRNFDFYINEDNS